MVYIFRYLNLQPDPCLFHCLVHDKSWEVKLFALWQATMIWQELLLYCISILTSAHHTFCASVCLGLYLCVWVGECICVCLHFIIHYGHCNLAFQTYDNKTDREKTVVYKREKNVQLFFLTKTLCNDFIGCLLKIKDFENDVFKSSGNWYILIQFPWILFPMMLVTKRLHWCCNGLIRNRRQAII